MSRKNVSFALLVVLLFTATNLLAHAQAGNTAIPTGASGQAATNGSQPPSPQPSSIGVSIKAASADGRGIKVADIIKNGPADQAGLKFGDVIIAVNDIPVGKPTDLIRIIGSLQPGTRITITYLRKGEKKQSAATVLERNKILTKDAVGLDADAFRVFAEQGDADAQFNLGALYFYGKGVSQDYAQAAAWYRKAADQGNADGQFNLGMLYESGKGVPPDYVQAASWYRKAADQGTAYAQFNLGGLYLNGRGVPKDEAQSAYWFRKAADQGDARAQFNLGWLYETGKGVTQDIAQATSWYRKAAEHGNADAQKRMQTLEASKATGNAPVRGDAPPGNAMALSVPKARATLKEALSKKYVGTMHYGLLAGFTYELGAATDVRLRTNGFDFVAPFACEKKHYDGKVSVTFKKYIQASSFKFGQKFYSVPLGSGCMSGKVPVQFVWADEAVAQNFADAFNRLVYAAYHQGEESAAFNAAARAWRENPVKPPLSPEAERQRILAENAIQEKKLDSAVEHYEGALEVQPMWPAGWFNLALIYAEQNDYPDASDRMKHYLELVPDAPDAKDARAQMIIWEDKANH